MIAAAKFDRMKTHLKIHHSKLVGPTVEAELADLSTMFGLQVGGMEAPLALVISSVAGGSSSGMFLDVVEALRSVDPVYNEPGRILTILYTPDVFSSVGQTKGVPPNTLGALAEVVTGVWSEGVSSASHVVYNGQGLQARARHGFGSKCNFLVGASNANVSLGSKEDVYEAVGESLSALVTDDRLQGYLVHFYINCVVLHSGNPGAVDDRSGLRDTLDNDQTMPFSALGMSRVNLGADRFRQYIAGVVSRDIVESLLWPEFAKKDPANPKPNEQLIEERVAQAWPDFRDACYLGDWVDQERATSYEATHQMQSRVEDCVAHSILDHGYPVTLYLLESLIDGVQQRSTTGESAEQLTQTIDGLLRPILDAAQAGFARLMQSVNVATMLDGRKNPWPIQPRYGEAVPSWLLPGGTERVLIQPADYEAILGTQTRNALQDVNDKSVWQQILRTRVALGRSLGGNEPVGVSFLRRVGAWTPQDVRASATGVTGQQATIAFPSSFEEFTGLVDAWLGEPRLSADLGTFLRQGLKAYVESGTPQEQVQRQNDFLAALTAAVNIAAPFVKVKPSVVAALHPNLSANSREVLVSTIPFPAGHPLHDPIRKVFRNGKLLHPGNAARADAWFATTNAHDISVFTTTSPMLPMVFDNLMVPIAQSWAQASPSTNSRLSFWTYRRARPLVECIPVGPKQLQAMVRGWFTGRLLGQITRQQERGSGWRVQIWNPDPPTTACNRSPSRCYQRTTCMALT
ncbi:MAG: hypothetical protein KGR25_09225 [Chloroflexi bacterium]|nr:hypothetical protein [Chloroflexota bacterium]